MKSKGLKDNEPHGSSPNAQPYFYGELCSPSIQQDGTVLCQDLGYNSTESGLHMSQSPQVSSGVSETLDSENTNRMACASLESYRATALGMPTKQEPCPVGLSSYHTIFSAEACDTHEEAGTEAAWLFISQ